VSGCSHGGDRRGIHELSAAALSTVYDQEILSPDLDLVTMKDRSRLGAESNPVDQGLSVRRPALDDRTALGRSTKEGMTGLDSLPGEDNPPGGIRAYGQFAGGNLISPPAELELHHELNS
jgi:hypothetical protein